MIKTSDYVIQRLVDHGVNHVFMIPGGGVMHLDDSVGKHGYSPVHRQSPRTGLCNCGGRICAGLGKVGCCASHDGTRGNKLLTGVIGQWLDSIPVLYISGQVKFETTIESCREVGLRQLGRPRDQYCRPGSAYHEVCRDGHRSVGCQAPH